MRGRHGKGREYARILFRVNEQEGFCYQAFAGRSRLAPW
jgi:hypothetical protein